MLPGSSGPSCSLTAKVLRQKGTKLLRVLKDELAEIGGWLIASASKEERNVFVRCFHDDTNICDSLVGNGKKRLSVLRRTNDGFEIAEEDLKIRGPGELSGLRQSGFLHLKFADLEKDVPMMAAARDEVDAILASDPGLLSMENAVIRQVLALQ